MNSVSANEAKTKFGTMLLKAQSHDITINRNGTPVAVMVSMEKYEELIKMKDELSGIQVDSAEK